MVKQLLVIALSWGLCGSGYAQTYDSSTRVLTLPTVSVDGSTFTNVKIRLDSFTVVSVDAPPPPPPAPVSNLEKWYGNWRATYSGGDRGTCSFSIVRYNTVQAKMSGSCTSSLGYGTYAVSGYLQETGAFNASSDSGAYFSGTASGTSASGTWSNPAARLSGTIVATKL